ncbi:ubiquinol oxidase subunit II [Vibrio palustris]|nr:ubiquinol oxidase subunit II [Vibrio palustris]
MEASRYKSIISKAGILMLALALSGCKFVLLDPKGNVGVQEKELILTALVLMLIVVIPVILMTIYFAYKYRANNTKQEEYAPEWSHSTKIELVVWIVPIVIIAILATITWRSSHHLEPSKPIAKDGQETMTIQVVALDWKWLFIYPDQKIATVNYVAFPQKTPVKFKLVADNIMNSFFIPSLGSQLYAMPGMVTRLHLIADEPGEYRGIGASYSGHGFSHMKFKAKALPDQASFKEWVAKVKASDKSIHDFSDYRKLAAPSENDPVTYFSSVPKGLFNDVVLQHPGNTMGQMHSMREQFEKSHSSESMHMDTEMHDSEHADTTEHKG